MRHFIQTKFDEEGSPRTHQQKKLTIDTVSKEASQLALLSPPSLSGVHPCKKLSAVGSEELTQNVEQFTEEGDFIMSDEADVPDSARLTPLIERAPLFSYKQKSEIEESIQYHSVLDIS